MTGSPLARAASISDLMYSRATQLSSPQEVRQRLIDSRMGSGRSPQNAQLTSITSTAGVWPNPARAPNPPAAKTALSRSVRNLSQIRSVIANPPFFSVCPKSAAHSGKFSGGYQRPVGVDADAGAGSSHAGFAARLKFGAVRLVGPMQDPLRRMPKAAWPAAARVFVGMAQHDLVHVDVAVIARQFLGFEIRNRDLRHNAQHGKTRRLERHPGRGRDMDPIRHDRQDVAHIELEREQIALPADNLHRVVLVKD